MAVAELFANQPATTVSSGGTDAPSSGTSQTWTVASSSSFPAAVTGTSQFHACDTAAGKTSEIIAVTNVSGTTWTVTRGAESTTPVAHASGFTIMQVVTAGALALFLQSENNLSDVASRQAALNNIAGAVASAEFLRGNGSNVQMSAIQASDVPVLNQSTTGTAAGLSSTLAIGSGGTGSTARNFAGLLTPAAVKTSAYSAAAGDYVPCDTTSAGFTVTLPGAPADLAVVGVKHVIQGGTNTVTVACAGSDVYNKTGGGTSATLSLASQGILVQYKASGGIWYVVSDDLPLTQLEALFLQAANNLSDVAGKAAAYNNISPMTTAGDTVYGGTSGAGTRLAGNTSATKNFLAQTGTGSASAAPAWGAIASGDLPAATTSAQGAVKLDGTAGDIQPVGTAAAAGSAGQAADAGHVHKGFARLATTGTAGFALQNATPSIITWTAPSDSAIHMFVCISVAHVTSTETGGVVQVVYESPVSGAGNHFSQILAGGLSTDTNGQTGTTIFALVQPGTTVTVEQTSALTAGAATVYAELWGS